MKFWKEFQKFESLDGIRRTIRHNHRNRRGMMMNQQPFFVISNKKVGGSGLNGVKTVVLKDRDILNASDPGKIVGCGNAHFRGLNPHTLFALKYSFPTFPH